MSQPVSDLVPGLPLSPAVLLFQASIPGRGRRAWGQRNSPDMLIGAPLPRAPRASPGQAKLSWDGTSTQTRGEGQKLRTLVRKTV